MTKFLDIHPKVYTISHQTSNQQVKNKKSPQKGGSKVIAKKEIPRENYLTTLQTNELVKTDVISIRSIDHQLYTLKQSRTALTVMYDKMHVVE